MTNTYPHHPILVITLVIILITLITLLTLFLIIPPSSSPNK